MRLHLWKVQLSVTDTFNFLRDAGKIATRKEEQLTIIIFINKAQGAFNNTTAFVTDNLSSFPFQKENYFAYLIFLNL